jgi:RND family efflux transporter MFP subunit
MILRWSLRPYTALILFTLLVFSACSKAQTSDAQGQTKSGDPQGGRGQRGRGAAGGGPTVAVKTAPVQRIAVQRLVDLSGTLVSPDQVRVSSEVSGVVSNVSAELGQEVRAGQVLVQLDTRELELALARAESALRQTEAQLGIENRTTAIPPDEQIASVRTAMANRDEARTQFNRTQEAINKGVLPRAELDTVQTRVKVTDASVQSALENVRSLKASLQDRQAAVDLAKKKLADASVRAPVNGAVSERLAQRGEFIRENTQVMTIVQLNPLKLEASVQEKYASVIRPNLQVKFQVEPFPDEIFLGRVLNISPSINQQSRTFPVEILVDNPTRKLKPGFFAKGAILTALDQNVIAAPEEAVSTLAGVSSVYVIDDGVVRQQTVTLGSHEGKFFEILTGLKGDELLALNNLSQIVTGMRVSIDEETSPVEANGAAARGRGGNGNSPKPKGRGNRAQGGSE